MQIIGKTIETLRNTIQKYGRFDFHNDLKWYLWNVTKGENVDDDPLSDANVVDPESFVKFVARHIDETLQVAIQNIFI